MKKSSGKKRVSSLTFLIATTAVLAAVAVLCLFGSNLLYAMRVRNVNEQRAEVEKRNTERYEAYRQEVQELQDRLTANNNISADWPTPDTQEGISIVDLTNYPLDNPGTVTVSRQDVMLGGLLLVNEWHSRPSDFDESSLVSIMTYARSMGVTKSIWRNSDQKLFPVAANALLDALNAAKEAGLSAADWLNILKAAVLSGEDLVIILDTSISGNGDWLTAFKAFIKWAKANGGVFTLARDM